MRVLIVEDDAKVSSFIVQGLSEEGHAVEVAADGVAGLDRATAGDFDVILLDRMLPGKDGLQVARQLRALGRTTPILMLTALDGAQDVRRGLEAGANDYLTKPFRFNDLLDRLDRLTTR